MYKPSRAQLAKFLPDPETVRAFEALFNLAAGDDGAVAALQSALDTLTNRVTVAEIGIDDGEINDAAVSAQATASLQAIDRLREALEVVALAPSPVTNDRSNVSSHRWNVRSLSASTTAVLGDFCECNAAGGNVTITPPNVAASKGGMIAISKVDASANQVIFNGPVNGAANAVTVVQYTTMTLVSNGTEWRLM